MLGAGVLTALGFLVAALAGGSQTEVTMPDDTMRSMPGQDATVPTAFETATFALGCFWGPDGQFGILPGVIRTRVGYAGGTLENPTYRNLGDHMETIQIDFDPNTISYEALLRAFLAGHDPFARPYSDQYRSSILYHDEAQERAARRALEALEAERGRQVRTEIVPFTGFTRAEDYHQKFRLQQVSALATEVRSLFPSFDAFVDATVSARINGYVSGFGTQEQLDTEIGAFGLSPSAEALLRRYVRNPG